MDETVNTDENRKTLIPDLSTSIQGQDLISTEVLSMSPQGFICPFSIAPLT